MLKILQSQNNLEIRENIVEDLIIEDNRVIGVITKDGEKI